MKTLLFSFAGFIACQQFCLAASPSVSLNSPSNQTVALNTALTISSDASDPDGNMTEHNLDVQRPDGEWNWQGGWSIQWPFQGGVNGSGYSSSKSASFTFNQLGVWHVRAAAADDDWSHSSTVEITVVGSLPSVSLDSPSNQTVALNTALTISSSASDPDGNMTEHNLDVQRPDGEWNWQGGWSIQWPFQGGVDGSGYSSSKSASFTFNQPGVWHVRSAAYDGTGWYYSSTAEIVVNAPASGHINIPATISVDTWTVNFSINDNGTVSGSHTYSSGSEGNYSVEYNIREPRAGPGYVTWEQQEYFISWQYPNTNYINHDQMLARYIRSTRSWVVTKIGSFRTGWLTHWQYAVHTPVNVALTYFSYRTDYNEDYPPYTPGEDFNMYPIPAQTL